MGRRRFVASAAIGMLAWAATVGTAEAATLVVHPGQSIQRAVNRAHPGDTVRLTPGVYRQNVTIRKRITLAGSGAGRHGSRLVPGAVPVPSPCTSGSSVNGICVAGQFDQSGNPGPPVHGVTIRHLSVRGFGGFGIVLFNADGTTVKGAAAVGNGEYGISGFLLHGVRFINSLARLNGAPGFYIGDSPQANAVVTGNRSFANGASSGVEGIGFLFRDSSSGRVWGNTARNNCAGMIFVDSSENPAPASHWTAWDNAASHNNLACAAEQGGGAPALSGIGITLFGASHSVLFGNRANNNQPSGPSVFSGGIVVASSAAAGGSDPVANLVKKNHAHGNSPFDILFDRTGSHNRFVDNDCGTSSPGWICS
ncbi:MAG TPA: right-handed parallel beta-helix repeat-containing protein [Gaiellales bacterium]|nr:right-handed parallel beta-helix repeat-containing protein [Gaiellales bacterium]